MIVLLISKTAKIKWNAANKKRYVELGYKFTKMGDEFEIDVNHLSKGSHAIVKWECDGGCGEIITGEYKTYLKNVKEDGKTYCIKCKKDGKFKSFEDLCIELNRHDLLERWDTEKNGCLPSEVSYGTHIEYWFKCLTHPEHHSELKSLNRFANGQNGSMDCIQCNSIMQFAIDNNKVNELNLKKNYELGLDLWSISCGSNEKIWFLCDNEETPYHNDFGGYEMTCHNFTRNHGCHYCNNTKVHPLDSLGQDIINIYGEDFLWKVWSDKNTISPFEVSPGSNTEVWWNCLDEDKNHEPYLRSCASSKKCKYRCPKCYDVSGENNPNYNPNLTDEDRMERRYIEGYKQFVKDVMARDNYTCQITGVKSNSKNLIVHHLDGYNWDKENRTNPDNGVVLCDEIHKLFHKLYGQGDNTKEQFEEFIMKIECGEIDISNII